MKKYSVRPRFVAGWLLLLWGVGTAMVFVGLGRDTDKLIDRQAEDWANNFNVDWLRSPSNYPNLFKTMERDYFRVIEGRNRYFEEMALTWVHPVSGEEVVLYPTAWVGSRPKERLTGTLISRPIDDPLDSERVYGYLHFQVDPWERWGSPITLLLAAFNVLFLVLIMLFWVSRVTTRFEESQSELEEKKKELILLEQLALAGRLSAGLLHDLKKPVIHIREEATEPPSEKRLGDIREQSEFFLAMLKDSGLEGFAKTRSVEAECCDVIELVDRSLRLVTYEKNDVEVEVRSNPDTPLVWGRSTRLVQVFSNLALNAYQAMEGRGKLTVEIRCEETEGGKNAVVIFRDSGPGVPDEVAEKIFEPFVSTGAGGSGLGLYIARTILEDMEGEITVRNREEGGAEFRVRIPEGS